jgi:hypothetical protein
MGRDLRADADGEQREAIIGSHGRFHDAVTSRHPKGKRPLQLMTVAACAQLDSFSDHSRSAVASDPRQAMREILDSLG